MHAVAVVIGAVIGVGVAANTTTTTPTVIVAILVPIIFAIISTIKKKQSWGFTGISQDSLGNLVVYCKNHPDKARRLGLYPFFPSSI